jgi:RHS repeat-associated protein
VGHREFTGQETIPDVGLINMNGRVYDPVLARFLSPDPDVQDSTDPQNYNRYSYVLNNPLRYSDPTGYNILGEILGGIGSFWGHVGGYLENPANDF